MKALREKDDINTVDGQSKAKVIDTVETNKMKDEITALKKKLMGNKINSLFVTLLK